MRPRTDGETPIRRFFFALFSSHNRAYLRARYFFAFAGGVVALHFCRDLPSLAWCGGAVVVCLLGGVRWRILRVLGAFALGFCWANWNGYATLQQNLPLALEKRDVTISGRVVGIPTQGERMLRFEFIVSRLQWRGADYPALGKIRLALYHRDEASPPLQIAHGQHWQFTARLRRARGFQNPGADYNYESDLFQRRIRASGYVRDVPPPRLLREARAVSVTKFRARSAEFIQSALAPNPRAGLISALTVGVRSQMQDADWEVLRATGTIHLVAISGLHIGLVATFVGVLVGWGWRFAGALPLRVPAPKAGVLAGLLAGFSYALLAGMTLPTQRAACMLVVATLALWCGRPVLSRETVALALAVVLAVNPLAPLADGLYLSFGAVVILLLASMGFTRVVGVAHRTGGDGSVAEVGESVFARIWRYGKALVAVQIALFVGMAPLLLSLYHQIPLLSPFANLIAIPLLGMVTVPLALLGLLFYAGGLEWFAVWMLRGALGSLDYLWVFLGWLTSMESAVWRAPTPPLWVLPLAMVGVLLLLARAALPARRIGLLWLLPLFAAHPIFYGGLANNADASGESTSRARSAYSGEVLRAGEFEYTMLEVGNGLASVVQTARHLLVYDAGPRFAGGFDSGKAIVSPFLQQLPRAQVGGGLDALVISHSDNDHSGGHRALLARFTPPRILTTHPHPHDEEEGAKRIPGAQQCERGQSWVWDEVHFTVLSPPPPRSVAKSDVSEFARKPAQAIFQDQNEASCVLRIHSRFGALLLTGDIGKSAENALLRSGQDLTADVLQVPHHGSNTSSTTKFLQQTQARIALVSVGHLNRYAHPNKAVRARYAEQDIPLYLTSDEGALTATFSRDGIALQSTRAAQQKYWIEPAKQLLAPLFLPVRRDLHARQ